MNIYFTIAILIGFALLAYAIVVGVFSLIGAIIERIIIKLAKKRKGFAYDMRNDIKPLEAV